MPGPAFPAMRFCHLICHSIDYFAHHNPLNQIINVNVILLSINEILFMGINLCDILQKK